MVNPTSIIQTIYPSRSFPTSRRTSPHIRLRPVGTILLPVQISGISHNNRGHHRRTLPLIPTRQATDKEIPPASPPRSSQPSSPPPESRQKRPRPRPTKRPPTRTVRRVDSFDDPGNPVGDHVEEEEVVPTETNGSPQPVKPQQTKRTQKEFPLLSDPSFQSGQPLRVVSNLSPSRSLRSSPDASPVRSHNVKGKGKPLAVSDDDTEGPH
jgi:hypothetical protein